MKWKAAMHGGAYLFKGTWLEAATVPMSSPRNVGRNPAGWLCRARTFGERGAKEDSVRYVGSVLHVSLLLSRL